MHSISVRHKLEIKYTIYLLYEVMYGMKHPNKRLQMTDIRANCARREKNDGMMGGNESDRFFSFHSLDAGCRARAARKRSEWKNK